jgi:lipid II:glycine glycyltransferase (peptidoglycan interpeptide bridge formation enzyme)
LKLEVKTDFDNAFISQWDAFVKAHPEGSVLQSHFCYKLFESTLNFDPVLVYCLDQEDHIAGLLLGVVIKESGWLKQAFSSRTVVYAGPLIGTEAGAPGQVFNLLLKRLVKEVKHRSIFIQFRPSFDLAGFQPEFEQLHFRFTPRLNLLVNTTDRKDVVHEMSASRLRQVKQSVKNGAEIIVPDQLSQIDEFYLLLSDLYRHKVKKPLPDVSFFHAFFEATRDGRNGQIFLIRHQQRIIGGIMAPGFAGNTLFEWYVCGLDEEFRSRHIYPSVLATWAAIDFASANSFGRFDFMGVGKPGIPYGVRDFKMRFGGTVVSYGRYIRINNKFLYTFAELGYNILSLMKKV